MIRRSEAIAGIAGALGGAAVSSAVLTQAKTRTALHQEVAFKATPARIYEILLDSTLFAAFSDMQAVIEQRAGGAFSMFSGMIAGRNVELVATQRIVQAWRSSSWDPGVYSIVRFELTSQAPGTLVVLDQTGFPDGEYDGLYSGWSERYWTPLKKFVARRRSNLR